MKICQPYLVGPSNNKTWVILIPGPHQSDLSLPNSDQIVSSHPTQAEAWEKSKKLAKEFNSEAILYNRSGKVRLHKSFRPLKDKKELRRINSEIYRLMTHDENDPESWWFHPLEKDYFDWLNAGNNRTLLTDCFNMKMFDKIVRMDFKELPKYINDQNPETASLVKYRLERNLV